MPEFGEMRHETIASDAAILSWSKFEEIKWFTSIKQRKKRRKRDKLITLPIYKYQNWPLFKVDEENRDEDKNEIVKMMPKSVTAPSVLLPSFVSLSLIVSLFLSILLFPEISVVKFNTMANCQLILDHPKNRNFKSNRHSISPMVSTYEPITQLPPFLSPVEMINVHKSKRDKEFSPIESSDGNSNKHDDLLRKLSSTMLLESLLRHPFPINKSTFPPLTISAVEHPKNNRTFQFDSRLSSTKPVVSKHKRFKQEPISNNQMDTSTTNISVSNNHEFGGTSDSFNSKSLTYLVERLLSMNPTKEQPPTHYERPKSRPKYSYEFTKPPNAKPANKHDLNINKPLQVPPNILSPLPPLNLDLLIKSEYDSRVEPMIKSLEEQQRLSTPSRPYHNGSKNINQKGVAGYSNHRDELMAGGSMATTTLNPLNDTENPQLTTPNLFVNMPTTTTTTLPPRISSTTTTRSQAKITDPMATPDLIDTNIDIDDFDESDDEEEEDNEETVGQNTKKSRVDKTRPQMNATFPRKVLKNVPPYQFVEQSMRTIIRPDSSRMNAQATNSNTSSASDFSKASSATTKSLAVDKSPVASNQGSLMYSDGGEEAAERANRRRLDEATAKTNKTVGRNGSSGKSQSLPKKKTPISDTSKSGSSTKSDKLGESFLLNQLFSTVNPLTELTNKLNEHEFPSTMSRDPSEFSPHNPLIYKGYVGKDDYLLSTTASDWSRPIGVRDHLPPMLHRYPYPTSRPATTPAPPTEPPSVPYNYFLNQPVTNAQSVPTMVIPTSDPPELTTKIPIFATSKFEVPLEKHEKRFSYQYPDKSSSQAKNQTKKWSVWHNSTSNQRADDLDTHRPQDLASLSENENTGRRKESVSNFNRSSEVSGKNWAPTKIDHENESQRTSSNPVATRKFFVAGNSSSPRLVSVDKKSSSSRDRNESTIKTLTPIDFRQYDKNRGVVATTTEIPPPVVLLSDEDDGQDQVAAGNGTVQSQKNLSHDQTRSNSVRHNGNSRNQTKISKADSAENDSRVHLPSEDYGNQSSPEGDNSEEVTTTTRKVKRPLTATTTTSASSTASKHGDVDIAVDNSNDADTDEQVKQAPSKPKQSHGRKKLARPMNRTHGFINHEPASSDISYAEIDKHNNHTTRLMGNGSRLDHPKESIMIDGADSGTIQLSSGMDSIGPSSFGSTIIPNSNFYGEASSESPTLDSSIPMLSPGITFKSQHNNIRHQHHDHQHANKVLPDDPYQKISSDNIISTLRQPFPSSPTLPDVKSTTETRTVIPNVLRDDTVINGDVKAAIGKTSNDRLVLALIAGFCVISVFCLVVAFTLMRCDDYRSVRNAERAALKLQRHRLKYTENHRINRQNRQSAAADVGGRSHLIVDDMNNHSSLDSGVNQMVSGHATCTHAKSIHHHHHHPPPPKPQHLLYQPHQLHQHQHHNQADSIDLDLWNSTRNRQIPSLRDTKSHHQPCTCANCAPNQRCLCRDEIITNNGNVNNTNNNNNTNGPHLSWMHPYYYMQQQGRSRPLFGVGSSVGTFFPRRMEDQNFRDGGSVDAQILIDNQPPLHHGTGNNNVRCTNPDHDHHSHQLCHHHNTTHHKCRFGHHRVKSNRSPLC